MSNQEIGQRLKETIVVIKLFELRLNFRETIEKLP